MPVGKLSVSAALLFAALICGIGAVPQTASAQQTQKPNILVIFGDDVGQTNISAYSFGLMGYSTPNIDRLANEGMKFTDYYGENSCTAARPSSLARRRSAPASPKWASPAPRSASRTAT